MSNPVFRKQIITQIRDALSKSKDAHDFSHPGLKGRLREIVIEDLISPLLPNGFNVSTGIVVDSFGNESLQQDVIIYSTTVLPEFMRRREQVIVPVEACIQVIEVKSRLNATNMKDAIVKGKSVKNLQLMKQEPGRILESLGVKAPKFVVSPIFSVLAFETDLVIDGKSEIERYNERVSTLDLSASVIWINDICVVERGYWFRGGDSPDGWAIKRPTNEFDEVVSMLSMAVNSLSFWVYLRGMPMFGRYISLE